jgi:hypothetical protein
MSTVDEDSGDSFTHIELFSAIVAEVETPDFVISLYELAALTSLFFLLKLLLSIDPLLLKRVNGVLVVRNLILKPIWP